MRYLVTVKPGSSQEKIVETADGLIIYLRAKAHDGEANNALVKLLSKNYKVPKTSIRITRGIKSKQKIIEMPE